MQNLSKFKISQHIIKITKKGYFRATHTHIDTKIFTKLPVNATVATQRDGLHKSTVIFRKNYNHSRWYVNLQEIILLHSQKVFHMNS